MDQSTNWRVHAGSLWPAFERTWLNVLNSTRPRVLSVQVSALGKRETSSPARKREDAPNVASALTSEEEGMLWTAKTLGDSSSGVLSQTMCWKATDGNKCLEAVYFSGDRPRKRKVAERLRWIERNEREHWGLLHITSRTPQTTTSNSFLGFSVWSFPTSMEQI